MRVISKTIFLSLVIAWFLGLFLFIGEIPRNYEESDKIADAAIVLTGGDKRIEEGVRLFKEKIAKKIFITGVSTKIKDKQEIPFVKQLKKKDFVEIGTEATSTNGNALEARDWIKKNNIKTIKIITANYHMPRSIVEFKRYNPDIIIEPHPVFPNKFDIHNWWSDKNSIILILKEYTKYIYVLFYIPANDN